MAILTDQGYRTLAELTVMAQELREAWRGVFERFWGAIVSVLPPTREEVLEALLLEGRAFVARFLSAFEQPTPEKTAEVVLALQEWARTFLARSEGRLLLPRIAYLPGGSRRDV